MNGFCNAVCPVNGDHLSLVALEENLRSRQMNSIVAPSILAVKHKSHGGIVTSRPVLDGRNTCQGVQEQ